MSKTIATSLKTPQKAPQLPDNVMDMFSLKGKVAAVSGASSGIGYDVAIAYMQAGADVAMWYNSNPHITELVDELSQKYGVKVKAYKCAVTSSKEVAETIEQIKKDFGGRIDILVGNAGVAWTEGPLVDLAETDEEKCDAEWNKVIDVDLNGIYRLAKNIGKVFKAQGHGSFIITSSMSGHIVNVPQMQTAYNAAKAGVLHMARSLAVEWAGFARVNTVSPGYIATEITNFAEDSLKDKWHSLTPMGREALPRELIGAYVYLASGASTYTTGSDIVVDGGYCCM
ncbi:SDR family oxidoreductase [Lachancea thermotolerans CBS 6340]|uniref:KLTH0F18062p n=1 Tax=Lachancea thermotolerans (strain ATCC 56472 / CBS 6340 / NRRL Y-8284) TaxID=559295 RepID=C5DJP4_LACTC|nr:KLTH0F18062p [Lachancea thermotolerans CBS 6340]CAR24533.1 KLTH0F18062p [Lachancea thermotolerans CBS 6340]